MGEEWEGSQITIPVCSRCDRIRVSDESGTGWRYLSNSDIEELTAGYQQIQFRPLVCPQCAEEGWKAKMQ